MMAEVFLLEYFEDRLEQKCNKKMNVIFSLPLIAGVALSRG